MPYHTSHQLPLQFEEWRDIPGYEGLYQVSDIGRVKRLYGYHSKSEHILRQAINKRFNRPQVSLWKNNKGKTWRVHNLVAISFLGFPLDGLEVNHINGDKMDNHLSNLEYVTRQQNIKHAVDTGLNPHKGESHPLARLTESDVNVIRLLSQCGITGRELARRYGVQPSQISRIINFRRWK